MPAKELGCYPVNPPFPECLLLLRSYETETCMSMTFSSGIQVVRETHQSSELSSHISVFVYKNRILTARWCDLRLSHGYATWIRSRRIVPRTINTLWWVECKVIQNSKGDTCKGQDSTTSKDSWFYNIAVVTPKIQAFFTMLIVERSTG